MEKKYLIMTLIVIGVLISGSLVFANWITDFFVKDETPKSNNLITGRVVWEESDQTPDVLYTFSNVGIGTATPGSSLDVIGDIYTSGNLYLNNDSSNDDVYLKFYDYTDRKNKFLMFDKWNYPIDNENSGFQLSDSLYILGTLVTTGNLGIGTSSPKAKLHVSGGLLYVDKPYGLVVKNPDSTCSYCGTDNNNQWSCSKKACP